MGPPLEVKLCFPAGNQYRPVNTLLNPFFRPIYTPPTGKSTIPKNSVCRNLNLVFVWMGPKLYAPRPGVTPGSSIKLASCLTFQTSRIRRSDDNKLGNGKVLRERKTATGESPGTSGDETNDCVYSHTSDIS